MSTLQVSNVNFESTANSQLVYSTNTLTVRTGGASIMVVNSTAINAVSNTFNLGTSSIAANGYAYLPSGIKMNWGVMVVNTTSTATWSSPFATAVVSVQVTPITTTHVAANVPYVSAVNTTTGTIRSASTTSTANVYFMAIGY